MMFKGEGDEEAKLGLQCCRNVSWPGARRRAKVVGGALGKLLKLWYVQEAVVDNVDDYERERLEK